MTNEDSQTYDARLPQIESAELAARILDLVAGERLTIIGLGLDEVGGLLRAHKNAIRGALLLEPGAGRSPDGILDRVLDDLAALAFESWPDWYGREEVTGQDLLEHVRTDRLVSGPWLRAAAKRISAGRHPRFRRTAKDIEFRQLMRAIDPMRPVLVAAIDPFLTASGVSDKIADRFLFIARRSPVPSGPKTKQLFSDFQKAGGVLISPTDDDLRKFWALRVMDEEAEAGGERDVFETWLRAERPLLDTNFFKQAGLSPPPVTLLPSLGPEGGSLAKAKETGVSEEPTTPAPRPEPTMAAPTTAAAPPMRTPTPAKPSRATVSADHPDAIPVGCRMAVGEGPVNVPTKLLPRHTAIIAGSGSGKTVLLRRIVEEAALAGIPAIVIDPNNDLSRLGDPWPERPDAFTTEDDAKAKRYFQTVEVVVWTPGTHRGNPLFLPVMPDFAGLGDDRDERQQAVEMAAEMAAPSPMPRALCSAAF